ncbi:MAG: hypothetical protein R2845_13895 [Thermomicrobiales bacterium]
MDAWAAAMSLPAMLGRNPYPIVAVLVVAIAVRSATMTRENDWSRLLKLAAVFASIGVVFNVITYHGGDRVIATIPEWIPVFGGPGDAQRARVRTLDGLALITLVMIWSTIAAQIDWSDVIRLTPPGLGLAVSSSIAITPCRRRSNRSVKFERSRRFADFRQKATPRPRSAGCAVAHRRSGTIDHPLGGARIARFRRTDEATNERSRGLALVAVALTAGIVAAAFLIVTGRGLLGIVAVGCDHRHRHCRAFVVQIDVSWRPTRYRPVRLSR